MDYLEREKRLSILNTTDITSSAAVESGPRAFEEAGISPREIDIAMIYDSFSITVLCLLEDLGFAKKRRRCNGLQTVGLGMTEPQTAQRSIRMAAVCPLIILA